MKPPRKSLSPPQSGVALLQAPSLAEFPWLVHGFSTRRGGVSSIPDSKASRTELNLAKVPWDHARNVKENRRLLLAGLNAEGMRLAVLNQIHSDLIRVLDGASPPTQALPGDGLVTDQPGLLLSILAADCLPILLVDTRQRVVAALHCGWRGTAHRLAQKGVGLLKQKFGSRETDLRAAIGPGIRVCCYRVGDEVAEEFECQFLYAAQILASRKEEESVLEKKYPLLFHKQQRGAHPGSSRRIHLDLVQANLRQLQDAGVAAKHIYADAPCTSCHPEFFFSHRRDGGRTGRMMGVIGIRE